MIIDIHSHIKLSISQPESEEFSKEQEKRELELLADMEKNKIDYRIVSALEARSVKESNQYISGFVSRYPDKLLGCAVINPKEYDCAERTLEALALPGISMLEFNSLEHGYYPDHCPGIDTILDIIECKNIPIKVFTGIGARSMPHQWAIHAKRHPSVKFIFLHMGCFDYGYGCVDLAGEYDNIYLETSNQYEVQILKKAFAGLGKIKCLFGSSYPERLTRCSVDLFEMFHLDEEYLRHIYSENARDMLAGRLPEYLELR